MILLPKVLYNSVQKSAKVSSILSMFNKVRECYYKHVVNVKHIIRQTKEIMSQIG